MVLAKRIFVLLALFLCANAGIFDQDLRNVGSNSVQLFERVSAMRVAENVAEVRDIANQWWQMSLRDMEKMTSRVDNMEISDDGTVSDICVSDAI
ncbi:hypothetical protein BGX38DRAFT_1181103 [Terfezia claveryi]|nr:hypothetical protein BGX38DRAFT_1181103 [Terfezia claveryi]